ncbi:MAG: YeeE/YedE family protein [Planctomycetes bacterium]|nr:YeeE/YedE family protein [Planctomycetota bacterium]
MDWDRVWPPLAGGLMIGVASAGLLALTAKTAGISGILDGILRREKGELSWKAAFVLGLVAGGVGLVLVRPELLAEKSLQPLPLMAVAGALVGFGTRFGGGCTSGHGVCGIGRLSKRSIFGTVTFIAAGALTVLALRMIREGA